MPTKEKRSKKSALFRSQCKCKARKKGTLTTVGKDVAIFSHNFATIPYCDTCIPARCVRAPSQDRMPTVVIKIYKKTMLIQFKVMKVGSIRIESTEDTLMKVNLTKNESI